MPKKSNSLRLSRSRWDNFIKCPKCFYLKEKHNINPPSQPGHPINSRVDSLLKEEFDILRRKGKPHPIFKEYNLNFIPFQHEDIDRWRNSLSGGISYIDEETNLIIQGGVDDVWYNIDTKELVVADYKAQSTTAEVEKEYYLKSQYHQGYKTQMDIYVYILRKMNFKVSSTSYFMVCNGVKTKDKFDANMEFDITLVDYETDTSWVQNKINDMKLTLDSNSIPETTFHCENCAYINKGSEFNNL